MSEIREAGQHAVWCSTSGTVLAGQDDLKTHYKSELHRYNLKRKAAGAWALKNAGAESWELGTLVWLLWRPRPHKPKRRFSIRSRIRCSRQRACERGWMPES